MLLTMWHVILQCNTLFVKNIGEGRPSRVWVVLVIGRKYSVSTHHTSVSPLFFLVQEVPCEGPVKILRNFWISNFRILKNDSNLSYQKSGKTKVNKKNILQWALSCDMNLSTSTLYLLKKVTCAFNMLYLWNTRNTVLAMIWAMSWENLFMTYANNKGADQPAHPRNLISAFVVRCLDSIVSPVSIFAISCV